MPINNNILMIVLSINKNVEFITKYLSDSQIENYPQLDYHGSTDTNSPEQRLYIFECIKLMDICPKIFEYLECYFDIYRPNVITPNDPKLLTCLMTALIVKLNNVISEENTIKMITFLINYGVDINTKLCCHIDSYLNLAVACDNNHYRYKIIECLLNHGAKIFLDGARNSAIHCLALIQNECYEGETEKILNLLLCKENNIDVVNHEDMTVFHASSMIEYNNSVNIMRLLLSKNVDLEKKICNTVTALHLTIRRSKLDLAMQKIKLLLDAGININSKDAHGNTLLHLAVIKYKKESYRIIDLLIKERGDELNLFNINNYGYSLFNSLSPQIKAMYNFVIVKDDENINEKVTCARCCKEIDKKSSIKCELNHLICKHCLFSLAKTSCSICNGNLLFTMKVIKKVD